MRGISIDTLKIIEKQLEIKFINIPTKSWNESQQFLKDKKCDILPAATKNSSRAKYANFTEPYLNLPLAILTHKKKGFISNMDDMLDKTMARKKGSGIITILKEKYPTLKIIQTKNIIDSFHFVAEGKAI